MKLYKSRACNRNFFVSKAAPKLLKLDFNFAYYFVTSSFETARFKSLEYQRNVHFCHVEQTSEH